MPNHAIRCLLPWLLLTACGGDGPSVECDATCPEGMNRVEVDFEGVIADGTMIVETAECNAFCEPVVQCLFPNVPVIDDTTFTCMPLEGYATVQPTIDVDTSFGDSWREVPDPVVTESTVGWQKIGFGDVDGDGASDVLTFFDGNVSTWFSVGDGTFETPVLGGLTEWATQSMVVGEFTGDGLADVALSVGFLGDPYTLWLFPGDGSGVYSAGFATATGIGREIHAAGDIDGDGRDDLLHWEDGGAVLFADESAGFVQVRLPVAPWGSQQATLLSLDADGDGLTDIAAGAAGGSVFWNAGGRSFSAPQTGANGTDALVGIMAVDVDLDGADELLVYNGDFGLLDAYDADQSFALSMSLDGGISSAFPLRGDIDGDGALDSVSSNVDLLMSNFGAPYLGQRPGLPGSAGGAVDIDGDGLAEAVTAEGFSSPATISVVWP